VWIGCSASGSKTSDMSAGGTTIGAAGGTVTAPDGSGVTIPAGALGGDIAITVTPTASPMPPPGFAPAGVAYTFGPEGTQFQVPVTVTLALSNLPAGVTSADVSVLTAPAGTSSYTLLTTTALDATHVQAQVSHFSDFYPGVGLCFEQSPCPPSGISGGTCCLSSGIKCCPSQCVGQGPACTAMPFTGWACTASSNCAK
jgi:hypothetical protein